MSYWVDKQTEQFLSYFTDPESASVGDSAASHKRAFGGDGSGGELLLQSKAVKNWMRRQMADSTMRSVRGDLRDIVAGRALRTKVTRKRRVMFDEEGQEVSDGLVLVEEVETDNPPSFGESMKAAEVLERMSRLGTGADDFRSDLPVDSVESLSDSDLLTEHPEYPGDGDPHAAVHRLPAPDPPKTPKEPRA